MNKELFCLVLQSGKCSKSTTEVEKLTKGMRQKLGYATLASLCCDDDWHDKNEYEIYFIHHKLHIR